MHRVRVADLLETLVDLQRRIHAALHARSARQAPDPHGAVGRPQRVQVLEGLACGRLVRRGDVDDEQARRAHVNCVNLIHVLSYSNHAAEATKQANAAKIAADAATAAVAMAKTTFDIARETEAEDLSTRTAASIESAKSQTAIADTFTVEVSKSVVEGKAIEDDTKALATELGKPNADQAAIADEGREVALRALKYFGSWRQDAAAQALSGTDADVLEYLRTGWDKAVQDEMRQQVADIASASQSEAVRTAATEALNGTDQQIRDFYLTDRHTAANTDYRVEVTRIYDTGGTAVKEAARAAMEDGSNQALLGFLNNGQYAARNTDERVTATQLFNSGGPEVKSAAKIALTGPVDHLHTFVQAGRYMADRKDQLAYTHIAQVERLIAEGGVIAAKAQENRWLAAKAAANANQAAGDAEMAAAEAEKSADLADTYAGQADAAADNAETSADQAAASSNAARSAANRAEQDAIASEESAAQAEFSASYARTSAEQARRLSEDAKASALAAGKNAKEAADIASAAWKDVATKREAELAEARRLAEAERKKEREDKPKCYVPMTRDHLPACAYGDTELVWPTIDPVMKEIAWEGLGLNDAKECIKDPALAK